MKKEKKRLFANLKSQKEDIHMDQKKKKNMTRRDFMKKVGKGAAAVTLTSMAPRIVKPVRAAAIPVPRLVILRKSRREM